MKRKICVVTGTRAEYGLLAPLMKEIKNNKALELQLIATGAHLSPEFGLTYQTIEKEGFKISEEIEILLSADSDTAIAKSVGLGIMGFADAFSRLKPDIVVGLGDRYELLAAVSAALFVKIPVAHIHGGELSQGVMDEQIRHSITKMSHIHFPATEEYKRRIIQLGESPQNVFNVGALALDNLKEIKLLDKNEFSDETGFEFGKKNFMVCFHPVARSNQTVEEQTKELLKALDSFPEAKIIFTGSNADAGGRKISEMLKEYAIKNKNRCAFFDSLGQKKYLSALKHVDMLIGNSSSGIIEMPYFKKPTVNIGTRQDGRIKAISVIDCDCVARSICEAIKKASSSEFLKSIKNFKHPYGMPGAAKKITKILAEINLDNILTKKFYDLPYLDKKPFQKKG